MAPVMTTGAGGNSGSGGQKRGSWEEDVSSEPCAMLVFNHVGLVGGPGSTRLEGDESSQFMCVYTIITTLPGSVACLVRFVALLVIVQVQKNNGRF